MSRRPPRSRRGGRAPRTGPRGAWVWPLGLLVLVVLVGAVTYLPLLAAPAVAACVGLVALAAFGLERTGTAVMVLALVLAPMNAVRPSAAVSAVTMSDALLVVGIGLLAPLILLGSPGRLPRALAWGAAVVFVVGLLASVLAPDPITSFNYMARFVVAAMVLPFVFAWWRPSPRVVDWLAGGFVAGQVVSTILGRALGHVTDGRDYGLTTHPNFFGLGALLGGALCLYLHARTRGRVRLLVWFAALVCVYGTYSSGSRAALLVAGLVVLAYPLLERSVVAAYWVLIGVATGALVGSALLAGAAADSSLGRLRGNVGTQGSDQQRSQLLQDGLAAFGRHPVFGNGFEHAMEYHNTYVQAISSVGILGIGGYLLLVWAGVRPLFAVRGPMHHLGYVGLAYAAMGPLTNSFWDRFVWTGMALAIAAGAAARTTGSVDQPVPPPGAAPATTSRADAERADERPDAGRHERGVGPVNPRGTLASGRHLAHRATHSARRLAQTFTAFDNGTDLLRGLTSRRDGDLVFRTRDGLRVTCPNVAGARVPVYEVFAEDAYRLGWFTRDLRPAPRVLDVGAHIGCFSLAVAARHPGARIGAYEASPGTAAYLSGNVADNGLAGRVTAYNQAVAGTAGTLELTEHALGSSLPASPRRAVAPAP